MRQVGRQRRTVVADVAGYVEQPTENRLAHRHGDRTAGRAHRDAAFKPGRCLKRDTADRGLVKMGLNLDDEDTRLIPLDDKGFVEVGKCAVRKCDIDHGSAHGENSSARLRRLRHRVDRQSF